jgi:hypothetical protein
MDENWKSDGVLLVTLDDDQLECHPDKFFCKAENSGLSLVSLQVGNSSWEEEKDSWELKNGHGGGDDGDWRDDNGNGDGKGEKDGQSKDESFSDGVQSAPYFGSFAGVYVAKGVDGTAIIQKLEPAASMKKPEEFFCRLEADSLGSPSPRELTEKDMIKEACRLHPMRCKRNPHLQKDLFLVATSNDIQRNGVLLVKLDWPGKPPLSASDNNNDPPESLDGGFHCAWQRLAADYNDHGASGKAVGDLSLIAQGYRKWSYNHRIFIVHSIGYSDSDISSLISVDKRWDRRGHGQERVLAGAEYLPDPHPKDFATVPIPVSSSKYKSLISRPLKRSEEHELSASTTPGQLPTNPVFYHAIIQSQIAVCAAARFRNNLHRQYCVVADKNLDSFEGPVILARVDWSVGDNIAFRKDDENIKALIGKLIDGNLLGKGPRQYRELRLD